MPTKKQPYFLYKTGLKDKGISPFNESAVMNMSIHPKYGRWEFHILALQMS